MNKERFEYGQRAEGRRVEPAEVKWGRQRHEAQMKREDERRLGKVRRELAVVVPNITIVLPASDNEKQGAVPEARAEKQSLSEAFFEWVIKGFGLLLALTAGAIEGEAKKAEAGGNA